MKKTISIMFVFIVIYLGLMYVAEKKYNYDWSPYPKQERPVVDQSTILTTDVLPTAQQDATKQDSVIEQGILPAENKNYLDQAHSEGLEEQTPALEEQEEQNIQPETKQDFPTITEEQNLTIEQTTQEQAETILTQEATAQQIIQEASVKTPETTISAQEKIEQNITQVAKPLTLKEQLEAKDLIDIETLPVKIFLDLRYATENNFTGKKLYKRAKCYLKKPAAQALAKAAKAALNAEEPFYLCAYDCYRPASVQKILVNSAQEVGFVSRVSNHSRGMAIDIGPCDENGEALVTPTEFDTFSPLSAAYYEGDEIPQIAIENRTALQKVMKEAGFSTISKEWWHFDYKGAKNEEVLNIRF